MHLQKNDLVALVSPAGFLPDDTIVQQARDLLDRWHLRSYVAPHALQQSGHFAGTDQQRLSDLQAALDNPEVKMIWALRGGYGSIRIVDALDFTSFINSPKILTGFSDISILHARIQQLGFESLHAFMPIQLKKNIGEEVFLQTRRALEGKSITYRFEKSKYTIGFQTVEAVVMGGNLANLYSLLGTDLALDTHQKILFIEDIGEHLYQIDRMMISLKKNGKLQHLKALLVGQFSDIPEDKPAFGKTYQEIILEHTAEYDFPVIFNAPIGHISQNYPLMLGRNLKLSEDNRHIILHQPGLK